MEPYFQHSFFEFTMKESHNVMSLNTLSNKDVVAVILCENFLQCDNAAPKYAKLKNDKGKNFELLFVDGTKFFWNVNRNDEETRCLADYLKCKSHCNVSNDEGLCFIIDNRSHNPEKEAVHYIGQNVSEEKLSYEIDQYFE